MRVYHLLGKVRAVNAQPSEALVYSEIKKALLPTVVFIGGVPLSGKSEAAKHLAQVIHWQYISMFQLQVGYKVRTGVERVNALIKYIIRSNKPCFVVDDFFSTPEEIKLFSSQFTAPWKVFISEVPRDHIERKINSDRELDKSN